MNKVEFINALKEKLSNIPLKEVEERISFYSEMIDDKIEDGISEEDAVNQIGSVDEVINQILKEIPLSKIVKEKRKTIKSKQLKAWEIVLLALGSPIWLSLLIAFLAILLSIYVSLWSVVILVCAIFVSFIGCSIIGLIAGLIFCLSQQVNYGLMLIGASLILAGLSIFMFFLSKLCIISIIKFTKFIVLKIKNMLIRKEK
jgi:uncharacterized membrane protein